jgi:hypothetical protein
MWLLMLRCDKCAKVLREWPTGDKMSHIVTLT